MSMYNALLGINPLAPLLLTMLGLKQEDVGRLRDCFLSTKDDNGNDVNDGLVSICVYTRNGGGNRDDYQEVIDNLSKHPCYLMDKDDNFDSTYCSIFFKIPEEYMDKINSVFKDFGTTCPEDVVPKRPHERFTQLMNKLTSGDMEDPQVKNALEMGKKIFSELEKGVTKIEL